MVKRVLISAVIILLAWVAVDLFLHRYFLATIYDQSPALWRPFKELNIGLIYLVTFLLIAVFEAIYFLLIKPKSVRAGLIFGALMGLALGAGAGFGTYIHMPVPIALAWGWSVGGWLKAVAAGGILGALIPETKTG